MSEFTLLDIESASCPGCPSCERYVNCFCGAWGYEIIPRQLAFSVKRGDQTRISIDYSSNSSGVITPFKI